MSASHTAESPAGVEDFTHRVLSGWDPALSIRPNQVLIPSQTAPATLQQLRQEMTQKTNNATARMVKSLKQGAFYLAPGAIRTIYGLGLPEHTTDQVCSLNFLNMDIHQHKVNYRLNAIASMPPTELLIGDTPDWRQWWLDQQDARIGIPRSWEHDPLQDPVSETLNTVIEAMRQQAVQHLPSFTDIARHIRKNPPKRARRFSLSQVYVTAIRIRNLALSLGLTAPELASVDPDPPEEVLKELEKNGITVRQDMGAIGALTELKGALGPTGLEDINASGPRRLWYDKYAEDGWMIHPVYYRSDHSSQLHPDLCQDHSDAEFRLMALTVPEHPGTEQSIINAPNPAAAVIAYLNRTTPKATLDYLENRTADPRPPPTAAPCPLAGRCASWCGYLQSQEEFPFPVTFDGDHRSCGYHQFLAIHQDSPPQLREAAAIHQTHELLKDHQTRKRQGRTRPNRADQEHAPATAARPAPVQVPLL